MTRSPLASLRPPILRQASRYAWGAGLTGGWLAAAALLAGCASPDDKRHDPAPDGEARTIEGDPLLPGNDARSTGSTRSGGLVIRHEDWRSMGYRWDWTGFPFVSPRSEVEHLVVLDDLVLTIDDNTWFSVLAAETGEGRWTQQASTPTTRFLGAAMGDGLILGFGQGEIYAFEIDSGSLEARMPLPGLGSTAPAVRDGVAMLGTAAGDAIAYRWGTEGGELLPPPITDGTVEWTYRVGEAVVHDPAIVDARNAVTFVSLAGEVLMLDIDSASAVGRFSMLGNAAGRPVSDGSRVVVPSRDRSIYVFEPFRDRYTDRIRIGREIVGELTLHDNVLYAEIEGQGLTAFDMAPGIRRGDRLGEVLWRAGSVSGTVIAEASGELLVWDDRTRTLTYVEREAGDVLQRQRLDSVTRITPDGFVDPALYLATSSDAIVKFVRR